jgi:hypothetical protein
LKISSLMAQILSTVLDAILVNVELTVVTSTVNISKTARGLQV